jgi:3-hydroxyisobutyrate dehydrogenase-like beta-hydroxyacid dehydrogenase
LSIIFRAEYERGGGNLKLGFIGFGEVGFELARGLKQAGLSDIFAFDPMADDSRYSPLVHGRAAEAGVELLSNPVEVVHATEVIIAAVPGSKALAVALALAPVLKQGQLYADVSTSTATSKRRMAEAIEVNGALFVDGALMGGLSMQHHKVPTLLSGNGSDAFIHFLSPYGMSLTKVSDTAGDAIAIKLIRSIAMKGLAALAVETLAAATKLGVETAVLRSIEDTLSAASFKDTLDWLITASAVHAERQVHEMNDVMLMMQEIGVEPTMTQGTARRLEWLAAKGYKEKFQGKKPHEWQEVADCW